MRFSKWPNGDVPNKAYCSLLLFLLGSSASAVEIDAGDWKFSASGNVNSDTNGKDAPSASPKTGDDGKKIGDEEKKTGLDRADQAAGEHGKQGRDNAREQQEEKKQ